MTPLELLTLTAKTFDQLNIPYAVTGSMASMYYGEYRSTNDIDVVADIRLEDVDRIVSAFPDSEFYVSDDAIRGAITHRQQFNIIHPTSGMKIDVIVLGESPHDLAELKRAKRVAFDKGSQASAPFVAPEDVILKKLWFYQMGGSDKHLRDIAGMFKVKRLSIDLQYLDEWSVRIGVESEWQSVRARLDL